MGFLNTKRKTVYFAMSILVIGVLIMAIVAYAFVFDSGTKKHSDSSPRSDKEISKDLPVEPIVNTQAFFAKNYETIVAVDLQADDWRSLASGIEITLEGHCDLTTTLPRVYPLNGNDFMVFWFSEQMHCASYVQCEEGVCNEIPNSEWSPRNYGGPVGSAVDLNSDGFDDFLLAKGGSNDNSYADTIFTVAFGQENGQFQFSDPIEHNPRGWTARRSLGDINADGYVDYVYHIQSSGGYTSTKIVAWYGNENGEFDQTDHMVLSLDFPVSAPVVADFNNDGLNDMFLPADDDIDDAGQSYMALNDGNGHFTVSPSIDFAPNQESGDNDNINGFGTATDINQDGNIDLQIRLDNWLTNSSTYRIYFGNGDGTFAEESTYLNAGWWFPPAQIVNQDIR